MSLAAIVRWTFIVALAVWVGTLVFFSFFVAPALFRGFPVEEASRAVGLVFPSYYRVGYSCGALLLAASGFFCLNGGARAVWGTATAVSACMLAATVYAGLAVLPHATALRPEILSPGATATAKQEFDRLHRLAVQLNGAVMAGGLVLTVVTARQLRP